MEATMKVEYSIVQVSARRYIVAQINWTNRFSCPTGNGCLATWKYRRGDKFFGPATLAECQQYISDHTKPVANSLE